jgi:hypothetical protein
MKMFSLIYLTSMSLLEQNTILRDNSIYAYFVLGKGRVSLFKGFALRGFCKGFWQAKLCIYEKS